MGQFGPLGTYLSFYQRIIFRQHFFSSSRLEDVSSGKTDRYDACNSGAQNLQIGTSARLQISFYTLKVIHHQFAFFLFSWSIPTIGLMCNFTLWLPFFRTIKMNFYCKIAIRFNLSKLCSADLNFNKKCFRLNQVSSLFIFISLRKYHKMIEEFCS